MKNNNVYYTLLYFGTAMVIVGEITQFINDNCDGEFLCKFMSKVGALIILFAGIYVAHKIIVKDIE